MRVEFAPEPPIEVWPEHWQPMEVFAAMRTQMVLSGMGIVIGYQYASLPVVMDMIGVPADARSQAFADFRMLEAEALTFFAERRNG